MANKEIYKLTVGVEVKGTEEAKSKLSAFEKMTQQVEKKTKALDRLSSSPAIKIKDGASSTINKINSNSKNLSRTVSSPTVRIIDNASSKILRVQSELKKIDTSKVTPTLRLKDEASNAAEKIQKKTDKLNESVPKVKIKTDEEAISKLDKAKITLSQFKSANVSPTVKLNDQASEKIEKIKVKEDKLKDKKIKIQTKDEASSTINKIQSKIDSWIKTGAKKVIAIGTAGALALGGLGLGTSLKTFSEYEQGLSNVKAVTDATNEQMKILGDTAKSLGASTAWSAVQVTQAEELLGQAGFSVNETISALPGLLSLASAGSLDLAAATDIASGTLRAFNLNAAESGHVADVLALSASATNSDVTDLGETMKYVAPVAQSLGISLEDTAAAAGLLSNQNIKGSQAGTILRQTMARLASPTAEAAKVMQKYGLNAFDAQGNMKPLSSLVDNLNSSLGKLTSQQRADAISTIFGTESMSGVLSLMNQGGQSLSDLSQKLREANGAADKMAETKLDNLAGQWEQLKGAVETMQIELGERLAPYAKHFVNWLTGKMPAITDSIVSATEVLTSNIPKVINMLKTLSPLIMGIGTGFAAFKIGGGISSAIGIITKVGGAIAGVVGGTTTLGSAMAAISGPVGWVALAIGAVATALFTAYNKSEKFREVIGKAWDRLKGLGSCIYEKISPALEKIGTFISEKVLPPLGKFAEFTLDGALDGFIIFCDFIENNVIPAVEKVSTIVGTTLKPVFKTTGDIIKSTYDNAIKPTIDFTEQKVIPVLEKVAKITGGNVVKGWEVLSNFLSNNVAPALEKVNSAISEKLLNAFDELGRSMDKAYNSMKPTLDKLNEENKKAGSKLKETWDKLKPTLDEITPKFQKLTDKNSELGQAIDKLKPIGDVLGGVGLAAILTTITTPLEVLKSVIEGVSGSVEGLSNSFKGVSQIVKGIKDGSWTETWQGIKLTTVGAIQYIEGLWSTFVGMLTAPVTAFIDILDSQFHEKIAGVKKVWNETIEFLKQPITGTITLFQNGVNKIRDSISEDGSNASFRSKVNDYVGLGLEGVKNAKGLMFGKQNYTGTDNGIRGINSVAERGCEIVMGRQFRWFDGGEKVLNHQKTMDLLQGNNAAKAYSTTNNISNAETKSFYLNGRENKKNAPQQYQLAQPQQVLVAGVGGNNIQVDVQVNGDNSDVGVLIQEVTQEVGRKLKEAMTNIKK